MASHPSNTRRGHRRPRTILLLTLGLVVAAFGTQGLSAGTGIEIESARWEGEDGKLTVKGENARSGKRVRLKDAVTGALLATTRAEDDGDFEFEVKGLESKPLRVRVSTRGSSDTATVESKSDDDDDDGGSGGGDPTPATPKSLAISGPASVAEGGKATFVATVTYSDGTTANRSSKATWSVSPAGPTISAGAFEAGTVSASTVYTLSASYTESGSAVSGTLNVTVTDTSGGGVTGSHAGRFKSYEGTATCLVCHTTEAKEIHGSIHYQWAGDSSKVVGTDYEDKGKLGGINDFCIYPDINWIGKLTNTSGKIVDGGCAKCHVGLGAKPGATPTTAELTNIDCLVCHSDSYERKVDTVNGAYRFVPDTDKMKVSLLQAASDIDEPSTDSCLDCHAYAGGGNNFKRGDIEDAHRNPSKDFDVHMAPKSAGGAGLTCLDCHKASSHRIAGRGTDLRPLDTSTAVACTDCHDAKPHDESDIDKHTTKVNCTVCHIPTFAKVAATDMERDWSKDGELNTARGLYDPHSVMKKNVVPTYRFYNGRSHFYEFGAKAVASNSGRVLMSGPDGSVSDSGSKLHAFKHHLGNQPQDPVTGRLLPLKIGLFFQSGKIADAVEKGIAGVGWTDNGYRFAKTERFMGLFHEVAPKSKALDCNDCHNGGSRIDFDALGYGTIEKRLGKPLCSSCHEDESDEWSSSELFKKVHEKHVKDKKYDCSACHNFSRR